MLRRWIALAAVVSAGAAGFIAVFGWMRTKPEAAERVLPPANAVALFPTEADEFVTLNDGGLVSRRSYGGQVSWSVSLNDTSGGIRPPHLVADAERVYVTHMHGVTALDARNGSLLWHSRGPSDRLLLSANLILAADCGFRSSIKDGRWVRDRRRVLARNVVTGDEAFRFELPDGDFEPMPITDAAGLFLVQSMSGKKDLAIFFDRNGAEHFRLDGLVVAVRSGAGARLVVTGRDVFRLSTAGTVEWSTPFKVDEWIPSGGLLSLPGGDMVAFIYCQIADSGVRILRFDPVRGGRVWETTCAGLGVSHSAYSHAADVQQVRDRLRVTSRGSSGTFVEILDIESGSLLRREIQN